MCLRIHAHLVAAKRTAVSGWHCTRLRDTTLVQTADPGAFSCWQDARVDEHIHRRSISARLKSDGTWSCGFCRSSLSRSCAAPPICNFNYTTARLQMQKRKPQAIPAAFGCTLILLRHPYPVRRVLLSPRRFAVCLRCGIFFILLQRVLDQPDDELLLFEVVFLEVCLQPLEEFFREAGSPWFSYHLSFFCSSFIL